jgi:HKD family nuclease
VSVVIGGAGQPLVVAALRAILCSSERASLAVSFLQVSGWDLLKSALSPQQISTLRVVCDDQMGITNPEAVRQILKAGAEVRAYSGTNIYHPKVFIAHHGKNPANYLVGSANLSEPALVSSVEAGITGVDADGSMVGWFDDLFENKSAHFDDARLQRLDAAFAARSRARLFFRQQAPAAATMSARKVPKSSDLELLDSLFSTLGDYIAPLSFDQAGNNVRNIRHAREVLAAKGWDTKQRSEMNLLGLASKGTLTSLGVAAQADQTDIEFAKRWIDWLSDTPDSELAKLSRYHTLVKFKRVLARFWSMQPEVRDFFLDRSANQKDGDLPILQAIELLANAQADVSVYSLIDVQTLAPLLGRLSAFPTNVRPAVSRYMRNKWSRDWGITDRRLILEAWRDAQ